MSIPNNKLYNIIDYIVYVPIIISFIVCIGAAITLTFALFSNNDLLKYWEQIVFFLLGFAFILKEYTRLYFKKIEINYQNTQNVSVSFINQYLESFYKFKDAMTNLPIEVFYENVSPHQLDEYSSIHLRYLKSKDLIIRVYLNKDLYKSLNQLTTSSTDLYNDFIIIRNNMMRRKIDVKNDSAKTHEESVKANNMYERSLSKFNEKTTIILDTINSIIAKHL